MNAEGRQYQILSVLGRGGFGTVYRARLSTEGGFSKTVALKVLNPDMEGVTEMASRMRDEARLLGLISHRSIVQVDALVMLGGRWTVVMEYVEGVDAKSLMRRGPMPIGPALEIVREMASALDVAYLTEDSEGHPMKLLHRDIKPGNVRITPAGEVKLLDFGIARADFQAREAKTRELAFGTPEYMAPERFEFTDGPEGDVYAVGVMLYELLTGESFGRTTLNRERHEARVMEALDKVWQATGGKSEELVRFVGAMLAYEPSARPTHRDCERRCTELWRTLGDVSLRDWAEEVIPTLTREEEEIADSATGQILTEETRSGAIPYPTAKMPGPGGGPTSGGWGTPVSQAAVSQAGIGPADGGALTQPAGGGSRMLVFMGVGAGLVLVGLLAAVAAFVAYDRWGRDTTDPGITTTQQPDPEGQEVKDPKVEVEDPKAEVEDPKAEVEDPKAEVEDPKAEVEVPKVEVEDPKAKVEQTTAPVETREAPVAPRAPSTGTVTLKGDAQVELVRGAKSYPPGKVPPGTYTVRVTFPGQAAQNSIRITVEAGQNVNLVCKSVSGLCVTR